MLEICKMSPNSVQRRERKKNQIFSSTCGLQRTQLSHEVGSWVVNYSNYYCRSEIKNKWAQNIGPGFTNRNQLQSNRRIWYPLVESVLRTKQNIYTSVLKRNEKEEVATRWTVVDRLLQNYTNFVFYQHAEKLQLQRHCRNFADTRTIFKKLT